MKRKIFHLARLSLLTAVLQFSLFAPTFAAPCDLTPGRGGAISSTIKITPWYEYLPGDDSTGRCRPELPKTPGGNVDIAKSATLILVAVIELLTRVAGLIAGGFVIWGAIQYITSQGEPEGLSNAKNTIQNALIGFVIVVLAIAIVQFVGRAFQ